MSFLLLLVLVLLLLLLPWLYPSHLSLFLERVKWEKGGWLYKQLIEGIYIFEWKGWSGSHCWNVGWGKYDGANEEAREKMLSWIISPSLSLSSYHSLETLDMFHAIIWIEEKESRVKVRKKWGHFSQVNYFLMRVSENRVILEHILKRGMPLEFWKFHVYQMKLVIYKGTKWNFLILIQSYV